MNNTNFAVRSASSLIRVWSAVNGPETALVSTWVKVETTKLRSDAVTDEIGGLLQCA